MATEHDTLDPIDPRTAQQLYLDQKATDCTESTVQSHEYRTNHFVRWCDENDIGNLNELSGRDLQAFRLWRQQDGDLKTISLNQQMSAIRVFVKWCGSIEAVPADLYQKVMVPRVSPEEERRDETLSAECAEKLLDHLSTFRYASIEQAIFALLWETGIRIGAANSIDVDDFDGENNRLDLIHRPNKGTRLKNGVAGERPTAITSKLAQIVRDFIDDTRRARLDQYDREPLLTTHGGMHRTSIRGVIYRVSAPCFRGESCSGWPGTEDRMCPGAASPHAIRRGSITHYLSEDVPVEIIGDKMDVSRDVLDTHYDKRSEKVKLEQQRAYLETV